MFWRDIIFSCLGHDCRQWLICVCAATKALSFRAVWVQSKPRIKGFVFQHQLSGATAVRTTLAAARNNETVAMMTPASHSTREVCICVHTTPSFWLRPTNGSVLLLLRFCSDSAVLAAGGMTYRQCLKYSDCEYSRLGQMFPQVTSKTHFHSSPHSQQVVGLILWSCSSCGVPLVSRWFSRFLHSS